jgi:hypothetical protein
VASLRSLRKQAISAALFAWITVLAGSLATICIGCVRVRKCHHTAAILVLILGKSPISVTDCVCSYSAHDRWVGNHLEVSHAASKTQQSALKRKTTTLTNS